ncbi:hypothetical protein [Chryseobacterium sp. MFBS3-17]|uniref:hypothetical protein n=1 Tax=Chryseobacterium sp. MFBS3-17 TaxID=2886689 RepID=UPI001D0E6213|nr:hypothetical protein [Chryseobacterium sp. MFBS3-17]MCC2590339.1 hypothetical protein [Chryseobacterium sp. MFBS3-17]
MRIFIAKHQKTGLKITFKYDLNGILRQLEFDGPWTAGKIEKVSANVTSTTDAMLSRMKTHDLTSGWIFAECTDVSFDAFYRKYPRKVGPKELTEKAWNKLPEADKLEAILFIDELVNLKSDGTAYPYPATYLNKKYWR